MPIASGRERFFTSRDGLQLFFRDWDGPGTAALCLPGLTRNSHDFLTLAARLASGRRVICPDLRGRGRSARAPDWRSYDFPVYLDDLRHLLAALGVGRVVVIGTSMGGLLGMAMAVAMPTCLAGLVINDVGPDISPGGAGRILAYIAENRPQPDWPAAVRHLKSVMPRLSLATDEDWLSFARGTFREGPGGQLDFDWDVRLVRPLLGPPEKMPDLWRLWQAVRTVPTLAIRGGASDILSAETFARMRAEKPDLVQVTVPGVGHAPTLDEPPARKAIDDFLRPL